MLDSDTTTIIGVCAVMVFVLAAFGIVCTMIIEIVFFVVWGLLKGIVCLIRRALGIATTPALADFAEIDALDHLTRWRREQKHSQIALVREIGSVPGVGFDGDLHRVVGSTPVDAEREDDAITVYWSPAGPTPEVSLTFDGDEVTAMVSPYDPRFPPTKIRVADLLARTVFPAAHGQAEAPEAVKATATSYSTDIVDRLMGRYGLGPHVQNGLPEFGWRQFQTTPICVEAAIEIFNLRVRLAELEVILEEKEDETDIA
jgi:hypothetical protein